MTVIFKNYFIFTVFFFTSDFVTAKASPQQGCCDNINDSCCSGERGYPGRGPPRGAGGPPGGAGGPPGGAGGPPVGAGGPQRAGPPPGGMSQSRQQPSGTSTNYFNITIPATIVIQYNGSLLAGTRPPNATLPLRPISMGPNVFNPNATVPNGLLPNVTLPNGLLPNVTLPIGRLPNVTLPNGLPPNGIALNGLRSDDCHGNHSSRCTTKYSSSKR